MFIPYGLGIWKRPSICYAKCNKASEITGSRLPKMFQIAQGQAARPRLR